VVCSGCRGLGVVVSCIHGLLCRKAYGMYAGDFYLHYMLCSLSWLGPCCAVVVCLQLPCSLYAMVCCIDACGWRCIG